MLLVVLCALYFITCFSQSLVDYVQPLSGTAASTTKSALKHSETGSAESNANTIPAVGLPFGMTQWVAQTRATETKCIPPYLYKDSLLTGFRGTHWISGSCMQDYGSVTIMPVTGKLKIKSDEYEVPFKHNEEIATPAYYKISTEKFTAEITATLRCAIMQFTVPEDDSLYLLSIPNSDYAKGFVKVDAINNVIYGYNPVHRIYQGWGQPAGFSGWFYIKIEKSFKIRGTFCDEGIILSDSLSNKKGTGAFAGFQLRKGEKLVIRIGTSFSSMEGAKRNLEQEIGEKSFDAVLANTKAKWEKALSSIAVETNNEKTKRVFYTSLYHAMQHPRLYNDVDGTYPKFSGNYELMKTGGQDYYDDFSMWDIYRAQLPLLELLDEKRTNDFVQSMIQKGEQGGWLPIFPCLNSYTAAMIGDHATAFIAGAFNKGIRGYDVNRAYALMRKNAFETPKDFSTYKNGMGRRALTSYLQYGYIPLEDSVQEAFHKKEQVSRTLEYAFDDYALSLMAKALKKNDDYGFLLKRSFNYRNVFDLQSRMVRGRHADGKWSNSFNADKREPYITEGTPRQYTFYVPHDVKGLAGLMGGEKKLENALDSLFAKNEYWHGNEPGHQVPFLYNYTSSPWKTQVLVRNILEEEYTDGPGGLSGNDDAGQMSAWYVFAAIGFYPTNPVSGEYLLCSPVFDKIVIRLPGKKQFEIIVHRSGENDSYIERVKWNNVEYKKNFITYKMIRKGGRLDIWLTGKPTTWGSNPSFRLTSISN